MSRRIPVFALSLAAVVATLGPAAGAAPQAPTVKASQIRVAPLPKLDGEHLTMRLVEVTYPPGAVSQAHRHPCPLVGYMLSGTIRMQIDNGAPQDYSAGDTFVELPTNVHTSATNLSPDTPAKFLVTFLCDKETPLTVPER
jgi:quercetin dioxygenase-like cupin family protein